MPPPPPPPPPPSRPQSLADLFLSFTVLALQGFGGMVAVVQRELVERKRWMTREEFLEEWAVAQILPGPNVCNLSVMIGQRHFGLRGAVVALAGMLTVPLLVVLLLMLAYASVAEHPAAQGALRGMGAVAAGLILGTALKLVVALRGNVMGLLACAVLAALAFVGIALLQLPLVVVLLVLGSAGSAWAYRCLGTPGSGVPGATAAPRSPSR